MSRVAFYLLREVDNFTARCVALVHLSELGHVLKGAFYRNRKALLAEGDELGEAIAHAVRMTQGACDVAHRRPCHHRAEGAYLRDVRLSVFLPHVLNEFIAPIVREVHVDVGRRGPFGIKETLEGELILERVHRCDAAEVGDERARHRATCVGENAFCARLTQKVCDDEKVRRVALFCDYRKLVVHTLPRLFVLLDSSFGKSRFDESFELLVGGASEGYGEGREDPASELKLEVAGFRYLSRVLQGLGQVGKELLHTRARQKREIPQCGLRASVEGAAGAYLVHKIARTGILG